jgi:hypothetical protein
MCTSQNSLVLVHQNVRGIISKTGELQEFFSNDKIYPHILCFTENHMSRNDIRSVGIEKYVLGSCFSQSTLQKGGVCACVRVCLYVFVMMYILITLISLMIAKKKVLKYLQYKLKLQTNK